jgi:methyltransferase (TIGR00027 family)
MRVFEIDEPETQAWKRRRLQELGYGIPDWLALVPVDFETTSWRERLAEAGFDAARPALLAATGVSMYLTREAVCAMLREAAGLAPGSTFVMNFILPMEYAAPQERSGRETSEAGAARSGTPFLSFFTPRDMREAAQAAGFGHVEIVPAAALAERYFSGRGDGLSASPSEAFLVAGV